VDVQMAGPASLDAPEGNEGASFVMQTARLSAQAYGGDYSVMVAEDGSTTLAAGTAVVQITVAGETRLLQPGQTHTERPAPLSSTIEPTDELDAEGSTPKPPRTDETSPDTGPPDEGPPGLEDREKETPPGLQDQVTPSAPDETDVPEEPPEDVESPDDDDDNEPPGDDGDKPPEDGPPPHGDGPPYGPPDPPPGLIDKGGTPPGQQKKDE
jgi:hypothetical protein